MPIVCEVPVRSITRAEFNRIDQRVMAAAYDSRNHFGRLCEEKVYENDLKKRLFAAGIFDVVTQAELWVSHKNFRKKYVLDLLAGQMLYELKAVGTLAASHETQALNYAAMLGLSRVKLINFGGPRVVGKLLATPFGEIDRTALTYDESEWAPFSAECDQLRTQVKGLLQDVGGYLAAKLYDEALISLCGGADACLKRLPVMREGTQLGYHSCRVYANQAAFVVSSEGNPERLENYRYQLISLLNTLPISVFQWINVHHAAVTFTTLRT